MERYLYVQKLSCGKEFHKSFFFAAMTDGGLDEFLEWRDKEEARQHPYFHWTKLNAVVRKYLKEIIIECGKSHYKREQDAHVSCMASVNMLIWKSGNCTLNENWKKSFCETVYGISTET